MSLPEQQSSYHQVNRGALRNVPWWNRLAYIQRCFPRAILNNIRQLRLPPGSRLMDYGCADQPYRGHLPDGVEYVAADLPGNPLADVEIEAAGSLPVKSEDFDVVLSTQVLEHVADPLLYLREAYRVLRPGGQLLISTHGMMPYHADPVDYWRWTGDGLCKILRDNGFEIKHFEGVMGLAPTGLQFFQDGLLAGLPRVLWPPFVLLMQGMICLTDRFHSSHSKRMNALVFIIRASKPEQDGMRE